MSQYTIIENEVVVLDYKTFHNVHFKQCALVYRGGGVPTLYGNYFDQCSWHFEDSALRTLQYLRVMIGPDSNPSLAEFFKSNILGIHDVRPPV